MTDGLARLVVQPTPLEATGVPNLRVKRDDLTHAEYGGNKVRKLVHLLAEAERAGKRRVVTLGGTGSHHVLATALFAKQAGLACAAALFSQPRTPHVDEVRGKIAATGAEIVEVEGRFAAWRAARRMLGPGDAWMPAGGSTPTGVLGYVDCADELARQMHRPADVAVVPTGSGGTAVGLALGLERLSLPTRVVAVTVADPAWLIHWNLRWLTVRAAASLGEARRVLRRMDFDARYLGGGYGVPLERAARARDVAATLGLHVEPTYTEKALLAALDLAASGRDVVYLHTLGG